MQEFVQIIIENRFIQHAILACVLASIGCGLMGSYVVVKRMGFMVGGIAHAALSGMGMAYYFSAAPMLGAVIAAIISAILIAQITLRFQQNEDILIAALWSFGMAVGILFLAKTPGYNVDLMSYLFGNILLTTRTDLWLMLSLDILLLVCVYTYYKEFLIIVFDEEFASVRGVKVSWYYTLLLCLIALSIVLMINMVGLILVLALLVLPAATAKLYARNFPQMIRHSILLSLLACLIGLGLSFPPDLPSGAMMVVVSALLYVVFLVVLKIRAA